MYCTCAICGRRKYKPPFTDTSEKLDLCPMCEKLQDVFIEKRLGQKKDTGERRRKEDKK